MDIRLKVNPKLSKDEIIARLPEIAKSIAEAIVSKGMKLSESLEKGSESHPVRAIAAAEDEAYGQGSDALAGIYSWLLRKLNVTVQKGGDLSEDDFRHEMLEKFGVKLGSKVDHKQAADIAKVLSMFPEDVMEGRVENISVDARFGASKRKYPNHGRYYDEGKRIVLNPHIFGEQTDYKTDDGERIDKLVHTLVHEIGHSVDDKHGLSNKKEWRAISGWKYIGDREPAEGTERMLLKEGGATTLKGKWQYRKGTNFPRWYGARNPKEDFCEAFAFAFLGATNYFKGQTGEAKLAFVRKAINELEKSGIPGIGLETETFDDLNKSQDFIGYVGRRISSLDGDESERIEKAASEFIFEECDGLFFEKGSSTEGGEEGKAGDSEPKDTPAPKASATPAAPEGAPPAGAAGVNPQKGREKPGHRYLKRETLPNGKYRYWYEMPSGHVYHSDDKEKEGDGALHDPARHQEHMPQTADFQKYKSQKSLSQLLPHPPEGVGHGHFDAPEIPDLVKDQKPHDEQFNAKATPEEKAAAIEEAAKVERAKKPARVQEDFSLKVADADKITDAQKTWAIESVHPTWGKGGNNVNITLRIKLKNDGEHIMKLEAAGHYVLAKYGAHMRNAISEFSSVFREAAAYAVNKALGWNLVPPTSVRELKGEGLRMVIKHLRTNYGKASGMDDVLKALENREMLHVSMQFFANDVKLHGNAGDAELPVRERQRWVLTDMITNHQDRHQMNIAYCKETDPDNRYGSKGDRYLAIDNGLAFGNGEMTGQARYMWGVNQRHVSGTFIEKEDLRDLRRLRDDLMKKSRRRKILPDEVREKIPHDQIMRMVHRIDWILRDENRNNKGEVMFPDWPSMSDWERRAFADKYGSNVKDKANADGKIPFDVSGKTDLVNYHAERKNLPDAAKLKQFAGKADMKKFLAPLLPHLNKNQQEIVNGFLDKHEAGMLNSAGGDLRRLIENMPKEFINQLFVKQLFHTRVKGFNSGHLDLIKETISHHLNKDRVKDFEKKISTYGGEAALQRYKSGEMTRAQLLQIVSHSGVQLAENQRILHPNLREQKLADKTADVEMGWKDPKAGGSEEGEFWHPKPGEKNPNWQGGKNPPAEAKPSEREQYRLAQEAAAAKGRKEAKADAKAGKPRLLKKDQPKKDTGNVPIKKEDFIDASEVLPESKKKGKTRKTGDGRDDVIEELRGEPKLVIDLER